MNSCVKGKVGEREWRDFLRERGIQAIRGQQHAGGTESPDVKSELDYFVHWEVKRVENLSIYPAMQQAIDDSSIEQIPVVAHRRNHKEWLCTVRADHLIKLLLLARNAAGSCASQIAAESSSIAVATLATPIEWPASRGTSSSQLMQLQQESEHEAQANPTRVTGPTANALLSEADAEENHEGPAG